MPAASCAINLFIFLTAAQRIFVPGCLEADSEPQIGQLVFSQFPVEQP